jgi:hypothetical protein
MQATLVAHACGAVLIGLLAVGAGSAQDAGAPPARRTQWAEVKWPFPLDQWGTGRAFHCAAAHCGTEITIYVRPKLGYCNCTTGVADDAELDRVGDLELLGSRFEGLQAGRPVMVGWMKGWSRPYRVQMTYATPVTALAVAFNDKCDVVVATVVADPRKITAAESAAIEFLNGDVVLRWVERELGI